MPKLYHSTVQHTAPLACAGHYLGLDTHDTPGDSHAAGLQAGMVLTVEPGLYIPNEPAYGEYAGIGVRLEDDVAVTTGQPLILSAEAPILPQDVEHVLAQSRRRSRCMFITK